MAFELRSDESVRKGLRRTLKKQIKQAQELLLEANGRNRDQAIHGARKSLKRARAVLRLVRPEIGESTFREANQCLRDFARPLSELRDAKVMVDVLSQLESQFRRRVTKQTIRHVRKVLAARARRLHKRAVGKGRTLTETGRKLRRVAPVIKEWTHVPNKWSSLGDGIEQTFRRAREAFCKAKSDSKANSDLQVVALHEWRKQVKYVRHHLELLRPIWPERMEQLAAEAREMSELLGDDHDLALLAQVLKEETDNFDEQADAELMLALINHRQAQLRSQALLLGQRFFQTEAKDFVRLLKGYWRTWQQASGQRTEGLAAYA